MARWWRRVRLRSYSKIRRPTTPARCSLPRSGWRPRRVPRPPLEGYPKLQPLDRNDLAARSADAGNGFAGVFNDGRHVVRVGVNNGVGIPRDRNMAVPENQVATP